jgi:hypothetical protein
MSLLAPFFLVGLLGIALPLWLHRLQTRNPERQPISSAMLLTQSERRLHVQKRLRFLFLLALRIALLALVALAFAQPLWKFAAGLLAANSAREHLIIIDTSLSMSATGRMEAARDEAERVIAELGTGDRAQLVAAGSTIELLGTGGNGATNDKGALRRALSQVQAGSGRLEYAAAMGAVDGLTGDSQLPLVVDLISDFQASGLSPRFAELLPRSQRDRQIELQLHPVAMTVTPNFAISSMRVATGTIDVNVRSYGGTSAQTVAVNLEQNGAARGRQQLLVPAGGEAAAHFTNVTLNAGDNRLVASLEPADRLAADDRYYAVLQGGGPQAVPLLTADARSTAMTFVGAALSVAGGRYRVQAQPIDSFDARTLERYPWLVVDDLGAVNATLAASLRTWIESGGALLAASGARAAALQSLPVSGERVRGLNARNADPLTIGRVDATHAALVNTSGWQSVSVARMLKLDPAASDRVLIATDDGAPLLIEQRIGAGRLLLLTTSLDNNWSDLPVAPVFVNFIAEAARWLAGDSEVSARQLAGATLPLPQAGPGAVQVIDPEGRELLSLASTRNAQSVRLQSAGIYQLVTPARESLLAVNLDARESDLQPIDADTLAGWRQAAVAAQAVAPAAASAQAEGRAVPLAQWLLALLALVVIAESLAGNWLLRRDTKAL